MISGVTREIAGRSETFRLKNRAKRAIEARMGKGLIALFTEVEDGFTFEFLTIALAESMDDGRGVDMDRADEIVDELGITQATDLLNEIAEAAFPEAKPDRAARPGKNAKGAARSK